MTVASVAATGFPGDVAEAGTLPRSNAVVGLGDQGVGMRWLQESAGSEISV